MGERSASGFSAEARLTPLERKLILAAERGEDFAPAAADLDRGQPIRGGLLRAMLLGTPLKHHPANGILSGPRAVRLTAHGVSIQGPARGGMAPRGASGRRPAAMVRIVGRVDLRNLKAADGGALPPLQAQGCRFEDAILLSKARLHSLVLRNCRFASLQADGATFDANVLISDCAPRSGSTDYNERYFAGRELVAPRGGGRPHLASTDAVPAGGGETGCRASACWPPGHGSHSDCALCCAINLSSAVLAGGLQVVRTYLRGPGQAQQAPVAGASPPCAVDLSHIHVRDSIEFVRCMVVGALNLMSARIEDDVWISGGKYLSHAELTAFNFQLANIGGVLAFQAEGATADERKSGIRAFPVVVVGRISAISLDSGEVWIGEGFYYARDHEGWGAFPTINLAKANIARSFKAGAYHVHHVLDPDAPTGTARIHGEICLLAANVGKNLEVHGVFPEDIGPILEFGNVYWRKLGVPPRPQECLRLTGVGVRVDRRVHISHGRFAECEDGSGSVPAGTAAPSATPSRRKSAAIDLFKSTIGTGFKIDDQSSCKGAVMLNSCVIGREVIVRCRRIEVSARDFERPGDIPVMLDISESTIRGQLKIGRREPNLDPETGAPAKEAIRIEGAVSLEGTSIQGSALIGHLTVDLTKHPSAAQESAGESTTEGEPAAPKGCAPGDAAGARPASQKSPERVGLNLRDCVCGSDLEVHGLIWKLPGVLRAEAAPPGRAASRSLLDRCYAHKFGSIGEGSYAVVDLRGLQCGLIRDGFGGEWGLFSGLQLRLAGIAIRGVEPACQEPPHTNPNDEEGLRKWPPAKVARIAPIARLRWLSFQSRRQEMTPEVIETPAKPVLEPPRLRDWWPAFWHRYQCSRQDDFVPQAYEAFSTAHRQAGEDKIAQEILVEKKNYENALRFRRLTDLWNAKTSHAVKIGAIGLVLLLVWLASRSGFAPPNDADIRWMRRGLAATVLVILFWPYFVALFHILFWAGFRYGLSPSRALFIFASCISLGWVGVHYARNGGFATVTSWQGKDVLDPAVALVLEVDPEPALQEPDGNLAVLADAGNDLRAGGTRVEGRAIYASPSPCNLNVSSLIYALDMFIPLIDLDQERRCGIRDGLPSEPHDRYFVWRLAKALYEMLGWIITSLVILTITGVLRRDLER